MPEKNNLLTGGFISATNYCLWLASSVAFSTKGKQKPHSGKPLLSQWPGSRQFIWVQGTQKYTIAELIPPTSYFPLPRNNSIKLWIHQWSSQLPRSASLNIALSTWVYFWGEWDPCSNFNARKTRNLIRCLKKNSLPCISLIYFPIQLKVSQKLACGR